MAVTTAAVIGGVAAAGSAYSSVRSANAQEDAANAAAAAAGGVAFSPFNLYGPGGQFAGFGTQAPMTYSSGGSAPPPTNFQGSTQQPPPGPGIASAPPMSFMQSGGAQGPGPAGPTAQGFTGSGGGLSGLISQTLARAQTAGAQPGAVNQFDATGTGTSPNGSFQFAIPVPPRSILGNSVDPATWQQEVQKYLADPNYRSPYGNNDYTASIRNYINQYTSAATQQSGLANPIPGQPFQTQSIPGQDIGIGLGDLEPSRAGLVGLANTGIAQAGQPLALPGNVQGAANIADLLYPLGIAGASSLASDSYGRASQLGSGAVGSNILDLLRQQAAPFENRQFQGMQNNLFNTGRLGSTGGGLQTEAFARGLGQTDLQRQTQALGLEDSLLSSAFNRFGQTTGIASDLTNQNLMNQLGLAQFPNELRSQDLNFALQALGGQGALNQQGLNNFQAALNAASTSANANVGAGSNVVAAAQNPNFGATQNAYGQILGGIASNLPSFADAFSGYQPGNFSTQLGSAANQQIGGQFGTPPYIPIGP